MYLRVEDVVYGVFNQARVLMELLSSGFTTLTHSQFKHLMIYQLSSSPHETCIVRRLTS